MNPTLSMPPRSEAEQIVNLTKELAWARTKIQSLEEWIRLERIRKYGPQQREA